ncbi:MAG: PrsW family intramembrane metalloprotease [Propionibacteriales bacterium]|nr:PrsW family intramembrane metalloprotease [Propionibacteriales bacterium]
MTTMTTPTAPPAIPKKLPKRKDQYRQRGRVLLIVLVWLTAIAGALGSIVMSFSAGEVEGAWLSFLFALLPLPILWAAYWWLDRYEPEPKRYKWAAFVWGAVMAVAIALAVQIFVQTTWDLSDETMATYVAPLSEEPAKCLFLLLTFLRARRVIDGFVDGLVYAGIVGLGFAYVENIGYYAASYLGSPDVDFHGAQGATTSFIVRGIASPFAHPLFTSAFGIAIGIAVGRKSKFAKLLLGTIGLAISIGLHGLWNGSLSYGGAEAFLTIYLILGLTLFGLVIFAMVARFRQVQTLRRSLSQIADRGWIHPDEIPYLSKFGYRKAARRYAEANYGRNAEKVVKKYQTLATEVAFLHHAVMAKHTKPHGVERTYALMDSMHALRPYLRFPPALQTTSHRR